MESYLIDTNIIIYLSVDKIPNPEKAQMIKIIDSEPHISIISKMELLGFRKVEHEIKSFVEHVSVLGLDELVVKETIEIRKNHKIKLPDAIIAATAIVYDLTLVTRNVSDFEGLRNIIIYNPFD